MPIDCSQVIERFRKYGFEYKKSSSNSSYLTFTFKSGFFHNAEVVQLAINDADEIDIASKIEDLKNLGVSIKRNKYDKIEQIENGLFKGFFDVERWKSRIKEEYNLYTDSILKSFPESEQLEYKYINAPYSLSENYSPLQENDIPIVENITKSIEIEGAQLILIEAPAGFGKTCTSYELIDQLAKQNNKPIPFFTEFSRDRQARVFGHVFVKEVDRAFSQVKSEVVIDELQNGRIVMVLDGFDELLGEDSKEKYEDNYENAEPMLETIGELLVKNAKIIITSRRAAIFDGSVFNEWLERYSDKFTFKRFRIHQPRIEDWLNEERRASLSNAGLELEKLSNPVLLAYLRALKLEQFHNLLKTPERVVSHYFTAMLEREMERQNLPMVPEDQAKVLATIAEHMCEKDYTSDGKDKIVELFKSKCSQILEATRKLYPVKDRPTLDELATTLATHAFFDRSNQGEGRIEFINEFVFGNYIAESILNFEGEWIASDERFVEPAIASYRARTLIERSELWNKLEYMKVFLSDSDRMSYEIKMLGCIQNEEYNSTSINSLDVNNTTFFKDKSVDSISFSNCCFSNVDFYIDNINNATFINCKFYDCSSVAETIKGNSIELLNCLANNNFIHELEENQVTEEVNSTSELTLQIFRRYFPLGSGSCERVHIPLASVYKIQVDGCTKRDITKEIKRLKREDLLVDATDGSYIAINVSKMAEIKQIIGRA